MVFGIAITVGIKINRSRIVTVINFFLNINNYILYRKILFKFIGFKINVIPVINS